jgi:hypothetical protein
MEPMDKSNELNRKTLSWLKDQSIDLRVGILQNYLSVCQIMINELLEEEVIDKVIRSQRMAGGAVGVIILAA